MKNFLRGRVIVLLGVGVLLGLWWLASWLVGEAILLPSPLEVFKDVVRLLGKQETYAHVFSSLRRIGQGLIVSAGLGFVLGVLSGKREWVFALLQPWLVVFQSLPAIVWILVALIWLPREVIPFWLVFLTTFPLWVLQIRQATLHGDERLLEMTEVFSVKGWRKWYAVYFPSFVLHSLVGLRSTLTLSLKVVVMAEVLAFPSFGMGTQLFWAKTYVNVEDLFAWALVLFGLGWMLDSVLGLGETLVEKILGMGKV